MSIKMYCTGEEISEFLDSFNELKPVTLFDREFVVQGMQSVPCRWQTNTYELDIDLIEFRKFSKPKSPEQILAAERYTHYKAKMEAAKKDMEYWEERL